MTKALKVTMVVWGILGILFGLAFIFIPRTLGNMAGFEEGPAYVRYMLAWLGSGFISVSVFLIIAARDPLRHIYWVQLSILWCGLHLVLAVGSIMRGYVDFGQAQMAIVLNAVFLAAFLAFYPWRRAA